MSSAPNDAVSGECLPLFLLDNDPQALAHIRSVAESVIRRDALALCVHAFTDLQAVEAAIVNANTHCLCLFDILMDEDEPGGMELARRLRARKLDVDIVFITSSQDYAIEGYEVYAAGYLLKPVKADDLSRVLRHLLNLHKAPEQTLKLVSDRVKVAIPLSAICYVDVYGKNCYVHTHDRVITTSTRLKEIAGQLPKDSFLQCHRSCVVNLSHVRAALSDHLQMDNGDRVPIRVRESLAIRCRCAEFLWNSLHQEGE